MEVEHSEIELLYKKRCFQKYMLSNGQSLPWIMQQIKNRKVIVLIFTLRWDTKTFHKSRTDSRLATPTVFHGIHHLYSTEYRRKLLALGWQITKQLSGFLPFLLSNNKNCRLKKREFSLCDKHKKAVKPIIHHNSAVSKSLLEKF